MSSTIAPTTTTTTTPAPTTATPPKQNNTDAPVPNKPPPNVNKVAEGDDNTDFDYDVMLSDNINYFKREAQRISEDKTLTDEQRKRANLSLDQHKKHQGEIMKKHKRRHTNTNKRRAETTKKSIDNLEKQLKRQRDDELQDAIKRNDALQKKLNGFGIDKILPDISTAWGANDKIPLLVKSYSNAIDTLTFMVSQRGVVNTANTSMKQDAVSAFDDRFGGFGGYQSPTKKARYAPVQQQQQQQQSSSSSTVVHNDDGWGGCSLSNANFISANGKNYGLKM